MCNRSLVVVAAIGTALLCCLPALAADNPPADASNLTAQQLTDMYAGKTWTWSNGGGAYTAADHTMIAATIDGLQQSYAEGRWYVRTGGRLCYQATWHDRYSGTPARTCFQHVQSGGVIYQRKLPKGAWSIFAHNPVQPDDMIKYIKPGNLVAEGYASAKAFLHRKDIRQVPAEYVENGRPKK